MSYRDKLSVSRKGLRTLNSTIPEVARAFGGLGKAMPSQMGPGPAMMYAAKAMSCFDKLAT